MGTSGSFSGSGGKNAKDLRKNIEKWLDELEGGSIKKKDECEDPQNLEDDQTQAAELDLRPVLKILRDSFGNVDNNKQADRKIVGGRLQSPSHSAGGVQRSIKRISTIAGISGSLAAAFVSRDRELIESAGLNYDELLLLKDSIEVGKKIVDAAIAFQDEGTIAASEERFIASTVVGWILEFPSSDPPSPEIIVRKNIAVIIEQVVLTEIYEMFIDKDLDLEAIEQEINTAARLYAESADLSVEGATAKEITQAIEDGIRRIVEIFADSE